MTATTGARSLRDDARHDDRKRGKTPAQWFCYLAGAALLLAGLLGFLADATFDTAGSVDTAGGNADGQLQGDGFLGFEVNGWHNVVHIASGLLLLAAAPKRKSAKTIALVFGVLYGIVTLIGLVDGNDVLGLIPVNPADNVLHLVLSAAAILSSLVSDGDDRRHAKHDGTVTERRVVTDGNRDGRFDRTLEPQDHNTVGRR